MKTHLPEASPHLVEDVVKAMQKIRRMNLSKIPSIRATVDWIKGVIMFDRKELDEDSLKKTINVVIKNEEDREKVLKSFHK